MVSGLSEKEAEAFANASIGLAEPVEKYFLWRPMLRDAGDEMSWRLRLTEGQMYWSHSISGITGVRPRCLASKCYYRVRL